MDLEHLKRTAESLGFPATLREAEELVNFEVPEGSGNYVAGRVTRDGLAFAVICGLEISEDHRQVFRAAPPRSVEKAVHDVASYLCGHDVEFELDYFEGIPRELQIATR